METLRPTLIERLRTRAHDPTLVTDTVAMVKSVVAPPASPQLLAATETMLGYSLPSLLRTIYLTIGNGGFGPGYGLLPLDSTSGDSIVRFAQWNRQPDPDDPLWHWPDGLLIVCDWGCNSYSCLDCTQPAAPVVRFDANKHEDGMLWADAFQPEAPSLENWLEQWLNGLSLEERFTG